MLCKGNEQRQSCFDAESFTSSGSSSKDLGFGEEVPDDPEIFATELDESGIGAVSDPLFCENVNMGNSLCGCKKDVKGAESSRERFSSSLPPKPFNSPIRPTKIPELKMMSKSMVSTRDNVFPEHSRNKDSYYSFRGSSYCDTFGSAGNRGGIAHGSLEQLAEREKSLKEQSLELLKKCRDKKRPDVIRNYPARSITFPLRRPGPLDLSNILTPASEFDAKYGQGMSLNPIQTSFESIMNYGEELKTLESDYGMPKSMKKSSFFDDKGILQFKSPKKAKKSSLGEGLPNSASLQCNIRARCGCCRWISMLHRIHKKSCPIKHKTTKTGRYRFVRRDRCVCACCCEQKSSSNQTIKLECFLDAPPFSYMVWFALMALVVRFLLFCFFKE